MGDTFGFKGLAKGPGVTTVVTRVKGTVAAMATA